MKLLGILLIVNSLILTAWQVSNNGGSKWIIVVCFISVFTGIALTIQDRITELSIQGVGTLKAATMKAQEQLEEITEIRNRVESQSATIDLVAQDAKKARELTEDVRKKSDAVEAQVTKVDAALHKANVNTDALSALLEFTNTVVSAQADDRRAFDKLKGWAGDPAFPYHREALQAWQKVFEEHCQLISMGGFTIPWSPGVDPSKFDLTRLIAEYSMLPEEMKIAMLEYIRNRSDIPKKERMAFMIDVMNTSLTLTTMEYAGRNFAALAELKIKPMALEYFTKWWAENKDKVGN
jgi:hypothetical protein